MESSAIQAAKIAVVSFTGLGKDALHVYVGLAVLVVAAVLARASLASFRPLIAVLAVACIGELADLYDDLSSIGHWQWRASLHDVLNTSFWPLILFLLARYTEILRRR